MSGSLSHYLRSHHGDLGPGKRPDELARPDRGELLTAVEAGRILRRTEAQVRALARAGKLPFELKAGRYYVRRGDAERLRGAL
jgi:hypothetical protein